MIKNLIRKALKDKDFALEVASILIGNSIVELKDENAYILVISDELTDQERDILVKSLPERVNFTVIGAAQASLIELTDLTKK
jgi:hypothetical protein